MGGLGPGQSPNDVTEAIALVMVATLVIFQGVVNGHLVFLSGDLT